MEERQELVNTIATYREEVNDFFVRMKNFVLTQENVTELKNAVNKEREALTALRTFDLKKDIERHKAIVKQSYEQQIKNADERLSELN